MKQGLTIPGNWDVISSEEIADLTESTSLDSTKAAVADAALVSFYGGAVNVRLDGTAATTTTGFVIAALAPPELLNVGDLSKVRMIENDSGEAATAFVHYLRHRGNG